MQLQGYDNFLQYWQRILEKVHHYFDAGLVYDHKVLQFFEKYDETINQENVAKIFWAELLNQWAHGRKNRKLNLFKT